MVGGADEVVSAEGGGAAPVPGPAGRRARGRSAAVASAASPSTREMILNAARASFLSRGFAKTTIRGVAREAGVDPALVCYYFGSKGDLFAAALNPNMRARISTQIATALEGDLRTAGARLVRLALTNWDDSGATVPFGTLLRWAATDEGATEAIESYVNAQVAAPLAEALVKVGAGRDEARERAALAAGQVVGLAIIRYLFRLEPIASAGVDHLVAVVAPSVQRYLTGPLMPRP